MNKVHTNTFHIQIGVFVSAAGVSSHAFVRKLKMRGGRLVMETFLKGSLDGVFGIVGSV